MTEESITGRDGFEQQFEAMIKDLVKEKMETLMKSERKAFLEEKGPQDVANGYYSRDWETRFGKVEDLQVPRDREGEFNTKLFSPCQRRSGWLEELVIKMYARGLSTRKIAGLLEEMYGAHYSSTTVSRITDLTLEEWRSRPLAKRYSVIFLDGMSFKLRRNRVANEVVYFAAGIDEEGYREMLGFWLGAEESSIVWKEILEGLKDRGVTEVLLVITDNLSGIREAEGEGRKREPLSSYLPGLISLLRKDRSFRLMLITRVIAGFHIMIIPYYIVFFRARMVGFQTYLLKLAPERKRPTYSGMQGTTIALTAPLPFLGAALIENFSYQLTFALVSAIMFGGFLINLFMEGKR